MRVNNGDVARKTINLIINSAKLTADLLKTAMMQYITGNVRNRGRVSLNTLAKSGKIDAIEVNSANIGDFKRTAAKYDVTYAVAKQRGTSTYYVMFSSAKAQNIEKAFREYAANKLKTHDKSGRVFCCSLEFRQMFRKKHLTIFSTTVRKSFFDTF